MFGNLCNYKLQFLIWWPKKRYIVELIFGFKKSLLIFGSQVSRRFGRNGFWSTHARRIYTRRDLRRTYREGVYTYACTRGTLPTQSTCIRLVSWHDAMYTILLYCTTRFSLNQPSSEWDMKISREFALIILLRKNEPKVRLVVCLCAGCVCEDVCMWLWA